METQSPSEMLESHGTISTVENMYKNKMIMGPMVRVSLLPARLLALDYGADLVYSEEVIDFKILSSERKENAVLKTVDFVLSDGTVVFQTCEREKGRVIFQMGTSDGQRALAAARRVEKDVAGIDINMGCPKSFSIQGGMGAALLTKPDKIKEILTTLVQGLSIPVTCKIRILPSLEDTLELVKLIESTGVKAIAVHGRTKDERPRHQNHNDYIKAITELVKIPVIANGGSMSVTEYNEIEKFRKATGSTSVMLARAALWNYSIFRKEGKHPIVDVLREYIKYTIQYRTAQPVVKYCVLRSLQDDICTIPEGEATQHAYTMEELCAIWDLTDYYRETTLRLKSMSQTQTDDEMATTFNKRKSEDGKTVIEMPLKYIRKYYRQGCSPKLILYEYTKKNQLDPPEYKTAYRIADRLFHCTLIVGDIKYSAKTWEKSKKCTEQAAALVFLKYNNMKDPRMMSPTDIFLNEQKNKKTESNNSKRMNPAGEQKTESENSKRMNPAGEQKTENETSKTMNPTGEQKTESENSKTMNPAGEQKTESENSKRMNPVENL